MIQVRIYHVVLGCIDKEELGKGGWRREENKEKREAEEEGGGEGGVVDKSPSTGLWRCLRISGLLWQGWRATLVYFSDGDLQEQSPLTDGYRWGTLRCSSQ